MFQREDQVGVELSGALGAAARRLENTRPRTLPTGMIKVFLLDSLRLSLRATTVVVPWLMHLTEVRTVRVTGLFRVLSLSLPCHRLPRSLIRLSH